jgi:hypothetical protein
VADANAGDTFEIRLRGRSPRSVETIGPKPVRFGRMLPIGVRGVNARIALQS